jgi:hypothetical protein
MNMEFQIGRSVTFGFDVGGGYIPPEPETSTPFIAGAMTPVFQGSLVNLAAGEVISGTAELEE